MNNIITEKGWSINGLTSEQFFLIKSILEDVKCECNELDEAYEENEISIVLSDYEVEIMKGIQEF